MISLSEIFSLKAPNDSETSMFVLVLASPQRLQSFISQQPSFISQCNMPLFHLATLLCRFVSRVGGAAQDSQPGSVQRAGADG